ncbi:MAG: DUF6174 domain-containing protein [Gemmatimonadetes bacterium]|nr:DUF6174 domain-containing protein [Gemmatimonadota bacterium]
MPMRGFGHGLALAAVVVMAPAACTSTGPDEGGDRQALEAARALWRSQRYDSYEFVEQRLCFCGGGIEPATVVVRNGARISVTVVATGEPIPEQFSQYYLTVEELFDFILDAWDRDAHEVEVTYHATLGYPTSIDVDYLENAIDEEMSYRASMLVPDR